jgi:hypothetical protein
MMDKYSYADFCNRLYKVERETRIVDSKELSLINGFYRSTLEHNNMGTEIRSFATLKEATEYVADLSLQYKTLFEDYSQWLGSLLRSCEDAHSDDDWYQKSAAFQKNLKGSTRKSPEARDSGKKGGKKKKSNSSCWVQSGAVWVSSTDQGQAEILFEAIEKINCKVQEIDKFKTTVQQLERIGLGKTVNYILYLEDDVPKKIVLRTKTGTQGEETFRFVAEISVPAIYEISG